MNLTKVTWILCFLALLPAGVLRGAEQSWIKVAADNRGFVHVPSGKPFIPWGFNYDHDDKGRLLEDYWEEEWATVVEDLQEMRALGANVARIHLQFGKFMEASDRPNQQALARLALLLKESERLGLYLDLTGLGCYHKKDVPAWYEALDEEGRWSAQARFWEAVAATCAASPAVFCYDLMNEPVVPGGKRKEGDWLGPAFGDKHFVQVITLDQKDRPRPAIAKAWVQRLATAIRKHDQRHLITVGLVDWSLNRPGLTSGFEPDAVVPDLDFLCVHVYPERGKVAEAIATLAAFNVGKPVLIEESFPLKCSMAEFKQFLDDAKPHSTGCIGFYWGKPIPELARSTKIGDAMLLGWLREFQARVAK